MEDNNKKILEAQRRLVSEPPATVFRFLGFFLVMCISNCVLSGLVSALCSVGAFSALIAFQHAQ